MSIDISKLNIGLTIISVLILFGITLIIVLVAYLRNRHNFFLQERELLKAQHDQILLQSQLEIQEQAFNDISDEIHDNIGQVLSLVRLNLNTMKPGTEIDKFKASDELLEKAIHDLRLLSHTLNGRQILLDGFETSVRKMLSSVEQTGKFKVEIDLQSGIEHLNGEKTLVVFRIIQEVINNILKHSQASLLKFQITRNTKGTSITLSDNGIGFSPEARLGLGLQNLRHRATLINAILEIRSVPGAGTTVSLQLQDE